MEPDEQVLFEIHTEIDENNDWFKQVLFLETFTGFDIHTPPITRINFEHRTLYRV